MSSERPEQLSEPSPGNRGPSDEAARPAATVLVRGEAIRDPQQTPPKDAPPKDKQKSPRKEVSEARLKLQSRLPNLDDDSEVGVQKEQIVVRDGKADLAFTGALVASAAPTSAPKGQWKEYRIYETNGGKHVF